MFTKLFWKDAVERAIKTAAQAAVALLTSGVTGIVDVDWMNVLSVSALAFVTSVLTSLISANTGDKGTAGLVKLNNSQGE